MKFIETGRYRSNTKNHPLVMVDDEDFDYLNQFNWCVNKENTVLSYRGNGKNKSTLIHRLIMKPPDSLEIDHIDGNRLNNQKSNLRLATSSQNKCNRGARKDNTSGYKGVSWHSQRRKWAARIMANGFYKSLGLFENILDAVLAYNSAAQKFHGEFAFINKL